MRTDIRYCLFVSSPVHMGCDEAYEPLSFAVDERNARLMSFDSFQFLAALQDSDAKNFLNICRKGTLESILEIYRFIRDRRSCISSSVREIPLCSGFVDHYRRTLRPSGQDRSAKRELNRFIIMRTSFLPNSQIPYIPGSAIKGSLRAAYLNALATGRAERSPARTAEDLEKDFLEFRNFDEDPFRMLKVSDFTPVGEAPTKVTYAVNRKKAPPFEARGPYQILEVLQPGSVFEGVVSVEIPNRRAGISHPLTIENIMKSAKYFYDKEIQRENGELQNMEARPVRPKYPQGFVPIRVGRHSGAESVTVEGYRSVKIIGQGGRSRSESRATTLWLASESAKPRDNSGLESFGWSVLGPISPELDYQFDERRKAVKKLPVLERPPGMPPVTDREELAGKAVPAPEPQVMEKTEIWEGALLSWSPGNQMVKALFQGRRAEAKGREIIPENMRERLIGKRKTVTASIEVEPVGNAFRIVKINS